MDSNVWGWYKRVSFMIDMMTSSNGNIFRVTGHLCGEFTGPRWTPRTKASDAELWCFLWSALSKQSRRWWFETLPRPLWRHSNGWMQKNWVWNIINIPYVVHSDIFWAFIKADILLVNNSFEGTERKPNDSYQFSKISTSRTQTETA